MQLSSFRSVRRSMPAVGTTAALEILVSNNTHGLDSWATAARALPAALQPLGEEAAGGSDAAGRTLRLLARNCELPEWVLFRRFHKQFHTERDRVSSWTRDWRAVPPCFTGLNLPYTAPTAPDTLPECAPSQIMELRRSWMVFMDVGSNSTPVSFYRYNLVWVRRDGLRLAQRPDRPSDTVALLR